MQGPRISYIDPNTVDSAMRAEFERCAREGTPRPENQAVRAHHQVLADTDGSMAPGFETMDALARSKQATNYWAKAAPKPASAQVAE